MNGRTNTTGLTANDWAEISEFAGLLQDGDDEGEIEQAEAAEAQAEKETARKSKRQQAVAESADISAEGLQSQYEALLAEHPKLLEQEVAVTLGDAVEAAGCITQPFDVGFGRVLAIKGHIKFCGTSGSKWTLVAKSSFYALGHRLWTETDKLSPQNLGKCHSLNFTAAKANFCYGIKGSRLCFYMKGKFCYWKFGWHCKGFNKTLHCFR